MFAWHHDTPNTHHAHTCTKGRINSPTHRKCFKKEQQSSQPLMCNTLYHTIRRLNCVSQTLWSMLALCKRAVPRTGERRVLHHSHSCLLRKRAVVPRGARALEDDVVSCRSCQVFTFLACRLRISCSEKHLFRSSCSEKHHLSGRVHSHDSREVVHNSSIFTGCLI